jgi:major membrane immunogen (membrane-anchored lipoprotein)
MKKITLLLLALILTACSFGARSELDKNRQTWQDAGITHYRFSLHIGCFCAFRDQMPLTVEVQNGEIISMTYSDGTIIDTTDPNYEIFSKHATIDRIFSELEAGLKGDADEVTVTYDSTRGVPSEIYFDYIQAAADDELSLSVSEFEILK